MADSGHAITHSCKCLNVQLKAHDPPPHSNSPEDIDGDGFISIYVGQEGIHVAHTQLTIRNRGPRTQRTVADGSETIRFISLTCLVCQTLVYRVSQPVLPDVDTTEGPVLPTGDWAETDVLQGHKGWVQVSENCLSGKSIEETQALPSYSRPFHIILSTAEVAASATEAESYYVTPPPSSPEVPSTPRSILPYIPALFPPPPFTPTHPVFVHLSGLATAESDKRRAEVEHELRRIVDEKVAELKATEAKLKKDVELLWSTFKARVEALENANAKPRLAHRRRSSGKHGESMTNGIPASVRVGEFVPSPALSARMPVAASAPAVSALSASLASSSLHHAMASRNGSSTREGTRLPSNSRSSTTRTTSPSTASSRTLDMPLDGEAEIREAHRRNMDESLDIATSFRFMMDIGAHVQSREPDVPGAVPEEQETSNVPTAAAATTGTPARERSPRAGKSAIKKTRAAGDEAVAATQDSLQSEDSDQAHETDAPTTPKGKRKVTFDVKPDITIIASEKPKVNGGKGPKPEEAVFDMENESAEEPVELSAQPSPAPSQPESPAAEPSESHPRRSSRRTASWSGLPSSFSALRPASLPLPSAIRAPIALEQVDDRARSQNTKDALFSPTAEGEIKRQDIDEPREFQEEAEVMDPHEAEILKLVAASTPSHRSAWKKDSSAWRTFVARQKAQKDERASAIPEEDESSATDGPAYYDESGDDSGQDDEQKDFWTNDTSMARSLPIPIGPLGSATAAADEKEVAALDKATSAAMRRASYAARDRHRSLDPGALDFTTEEDEEEDEEEDGTLSKQEADAGPRSLQRALTILQKRSEMPAAGMWRSLA